MSWRFMTIFFWGALAFASWPIQSSPCQLALKDINSLSLSDVKSNRNRFTQIAPNVWVNQVHDSTAPAALEHELRTAIKYGKPQVVVAKLDGWNDTPAFDAVEFHPDGSPAFNISYKTLQTTSLKRSRIATILFKALGQVEQVYDADWYAKQGYSIEGDHIVQSTGEFSNRPKSPEEMARFMGYFGMTPPQQRPTRIVLDLAAAGNQKPVIFEILRVRTENGRERINMLIEGQSKEAMDLVELQNSLRLHPHVDSYVIMGAKEKITVDREHIAVSSLDPSRAEQTKYYSSDNPSKYIFPSYTDTYAGRSLIPRDGTTELPPAHALPRTPQPVAGQANTTPRPIALDTPPFSLGEVEVDPAFRKNGDRLWIPQAVGIQPEVASTGAVTVMRKYLSVVDNNVVITQHFNKHVNSPLPFDGVLFNEQGQATSNFVMRELVFTPTGTYRHEKKVYELQSSLQQNLESAFLDESWFERQGYVLDGKQLVPQANSTNIVDPYYIERISGLFGMTPTQRRPTTTIIDFRSPESETPLKFNIFDSVWNGITETHITFEKDTTSKKSLNLNFLQNKLKKTQGVDAIVLMSSDQMIRIDRDNIEILPIPQS